MRRDSTRPISQARRRLLAGTALAPLAGCDAGGRDAPRHEGGWVGDSAERGHRLRALAPGDRLPAPAVVRKAAALVVGGGVAGLAAARRLEAAGIDDVRLLELEDEAGGNSRGHAMGGMACPLGAHYLPQPGPQAVEVIEWLDALGVRRLRTGVPVYDETMLCFSPQERLHLHGAWHAGLLPPVAGLPAAEQAATLRDYRRFAAAVEAVGTDGGFAIPTARSRWRPDLDALDAVTFDAWLDAQDLQAPALRWYLDYCCRDDYGAGSAWVSAWAGLHYFASRHGFHAPGDADPEDREAVLTWPEGNAWLARRLAAPLADRIVCGRVALRATESRDAVTVDAWDVGSGRVERWIAGQLVLAVPLFVAARLLEVPPPALRAVAAAQPHSPWLVANLQLREALDERPGAPLSWDNVFYDAGEPEPTLGYVDAMHQSLRVLPGPTVLTFYWALGGAAAARRRRDLLERPWSDWAALVVEQMARRHPDLPAKLVGVDLARHGHAMAVPVPGLRSGAALRALAEPGRRVQFGHADLAAYSVFEEAVYHGHRAGAAAAARLAGARPRDRA